MDKLRHRHRSDDIVPQMQGRGRSKSRPSGSIMTVLTRLPFVVLTVLIGFGGGAAAAEATDLLLVLAVENVIREEMAAFGAQEVHFPALLPREPYEATGRWEEYGDGIFRLKDRKGADYLLAPTHEEVFTLTVKDLYTSYKDLPLYDLPDPGQVPRRGASPRRPAARPRVLDEGQLLASTYTDEGLDVSYQAHRDAYERIFARLGLEYVIVQADAGAMGGSRSEEFLHPTPIGEDTFVRSAGGYAANVEAFTTTRPSRRARTTSSRRPRSSTPRTRRRSRPSSTSPTRSTRARRPRVDRRRHPQERRARAQAPRRHARGRRRRAARRSRGRHEARRGAVRAGRGRGRDRHRLREESACWSRATSGPGRRPGAVLGEESATGIRYLRRPAGRRRHRMDHRRQRRRQARLRPGRRARLRQRRHRGGRRGARRRPGPGRLRTRRARARHGDRPRLPARPQVRRGARAARCSTRTASSSPSRWARTASG